ncbi:MAG: response regulator, partial [Bacteroidota bacterium]
LALSKQLVDLHHGKIYAKNNEGAGTSFVVELQKGANHFDNEEISKEAVKLKKTEPVQPVKKESDKETPEKSLKVLVVEDDLEIRDYIRSLFVLEYQVMLANNGQEGFEMAKNKLPDVIISDVMMPVEDGISMCRRLKTTIETSHIPIILLTARAATPYKIGGLETGADDYLTKPFNSDELVLKVKNILSARQAYLDKLSRTHDFDPKRIAVTSTDEIFLSRLMEITEENIENRNLTVEQIADYLNVSRALLFTKIKTLTGNTPKGFIKDFRLKRAVQLLEDTDLNISQVAHKSGFHDYRYFTKVFKTRYGVSPKEYSNNFAESS